MLLLTFSCTVNTFVGLHVHVKNSLFMISVLTVWKRMLDYLRV